MGSLAGCAWSGVVGVEERADINEGVGGATLVAAGVSFAVPGRGDPQCLLELQGAGGVEHEPADEPVGGVGDGQLAVGFDWFGEFDECFGALAPQPDGVFAVATDSGAMIVTRSACWAPSIGSTGAGQEFFNTAI